MSPSERRVSRDIGASTILGRDSADRKAPRTVVLSGGVGGARMARGLEAVIPPDSLTVVVNVGDDDDVYGVRVCADLDTVLYTLAGCEGPEGWGLAGDTFEVMEHLGGLGVDTSFRLGDRDLATCLRRTEALRAGRPLHAVTADLAAAFGLDLSLLPASDDPVRTKVRTGDGWLDFQDYFVRRGHRDAVLELDFEGADAAKPAPGVLDALAAAELVVIAPSNPPLSVWPVLAVPGIRDAVGSAPKVVAVSPLFGGLALKGPADRVLATLGLPPGNAGIVAAYGDLLTDLVVDTTDSADAGLAGRGLRVHVADTRIPDRKSAARLARSLVG